MKSPTAVQVIPPEGKQLYPHNVEYENVAIGLALQYPEHAEALLDGLTPDDFFTPLAAVHFTGMGHVAKRGGTIDLSALQLQLGDQCSRDYLLAVSDGVLRSVNIPSLVRTLKDYSKRRAAVKASMRIVQAAIGGSDPANEQIEAARAEFDRLGDDHALERGYEDTSTIATRLRAAQDEQVPEGILTGITDIDRLLGRRGFGAGELVVIAARTGIGKSAFAIQVSAHVALRLERPVIYFSLEMSADEVIERAAICLSRVDADDVREHSLDDNQAVAYASALNKLSAAPMAVDDAGLMTVRHIRRHARRFQRKHGGRLGVIVVDYIQLLSSPGGAKHETRALEVATFTRELKALAKELRVPVVALSQLNRDPAKGQLRPRLHHLRESGAIEQDCDVALLIHRLTGNSDDKPNPSSPDFVPDDQAMVDLAKRRNGQPSLVSVRWSGETQRFDSLAHSAQDDRP